MDQILYSSFTSERAERYQICTQIMERNGNRVIRKTALHQDGKEHISNLRKYEQILKQTYQDSNLFSVCPIDAYGEDWVEFAYQQGKSVEQWLEEQVRLNKIDIIKEWLTCFWANLSKTSEGAFQPEADFKKKFGERLPEHTQLHGSRNQDIDLIFSNLFFTGEKPEELTITDYEWVYTFPIPLEYIYYRTIFFSVALSRAAEKDREAFYQIAGIYPDDFDAFLQMEIAFQRHITDGALSINQHYKRFGRSVHPIANIRSPYQLSIVADGQTVYSIMTSELKKHIDLSQYTASHVQVQVGYPFSVITLEEQNSEGWECENADWKNGNAYMAGIIPLIFSRKKEQINQLIYQIQDVDQFTYQETIKNRILCLGNQIQDKVEQINAYEVEWKQLAEAGKVLHNEPTALIRQKQTIRKNIQKKKGTGPDATIVIPTKNGGHLFRQVLDHVYGQVTQYTFEVICVDSGSTDDTLQIIKESPAKLLQIRPEEFGHGKTRNFGASHGTGEFICFLTQDALPVHESWLENMLNAMKLDPQIAGGFGRHLPYNECNFIDERDINGLFAGFGQTDTIYWNEDPDRYEKDPGYRSVLAFFSDNNSCLRRSVWEQYPYPDVEFAEDQIWMRQMIEKGYKKVYCPEATVYHSHNYNPSTYFMRYYDEHKGLYEIHGYTNLEHWWYIPAATCKHVASDVKYIRNMPGSTRSKLGKVKYSLKRNYARYAAGYIGGHYHEKSPEKQQKLDKKYSQQYRQRKGI